MTTGTASGTGLGRWTRALARWEMLLAAALLGLIVLGNSLSPFFLTPGNFANLVAALMEVAIMALPLTLIIILGEIDLSVESMAGLASAAVGFMWAAGVPLEIAIPIVLVIGATGGLLNGVLVARGGLPSLVVTLGTLALFRGLALIVLGPRGVSNFPPAFTEFGFGHVPGTLVPWPFVVFLALALVLGIVLHRTWIGRHIYAIGKNAGTARYSGVRVARLRIEPVRPVGDDRGPGRRDPHGAPLERPGRCRPGHDPDRRDGRPARGRQHLRRVGHDPGHRPGRPDGGGDAERAPARQRVGRGPEHRPRAAPDLVRRHPNLRSPGQDRPSIESEDAGTSRPTRSQWGEQAIRTGIEEERT